MSKMSVYDEKVDVLIVRDGEEQVVPFFDLRDGDFIPEMNCVIQGEAHFSGDESYDGWLVYDTKGNDYYPEDFGAELVYDPDAEDSGEEGEP